MYFFVCLRVFSRFCLGIAALALAGAARAQAPEGPQLPPPDTKIGAVHGEFRVGYYAVTQRYRYQGEYLAGTNFGRIGSSPLYFFADVDVEARQDTAHHRFQPDRLTGTFEVGARRAFGVAPLSIYVRHLSAHYIDRADLYQGSWDAVGARWQQQVGATLVSGSVASYLHVHQLDAQYHTDLDLQGVTALGALAGHAISLRSDLHLTTGSGGRGGFTDFWIEPSIALSTQTALFLGYGQIHDTNLSAANTDHPLMMGVRLVY